MAIVIEANGGFHLKTYSFVSIKTGELLERLKENGEPLKVQQSVLLARKNETYPSKSHWRVQELAVEKQRQIDEWERAVAVARAEPVAPSGDMTVTAFYETVFLPWLEELVKTGQKSHTTLVSYRRYWDTYLADHFNGTKTFKNYEPYIGAQFLKNLRRPTLRTKHCPSPSFICKRNLRPSDRTRVLQAQPVARHQSLKRARHRRRTGGSVQRKGSRGDDSEPR
jgi:RNA recognition motif-containing protein